MRFAARFVPLVITLAGSLSTESAYAASGWLNWRGPDQNGVSKARVKLPDNSLMPPRPTWKGFLKVSLVNIPVKVFPATESAAVLSFNQLHAECQTRIQQKRGCPHCEREVSNAELAQGYELAHASSRRREHG